MDTNDITVQLLTEIRDEIRTTRTDLGGRIDQTNARIDQTNSRLDQTNHRLDQTNARLVETEIRLGTAIADMAGTLHDVRDRLIENLALGQRVDRVEQDIAELKRSR
jgi:hypothetical protein